MFDIIDLLKQILRALENQSKPKLWKIDDIADYFSMSRSTVEQKIISSESFPKPFTINNTHPRWLPDEVVKWVARQR